MGRSYHDYKEEVESYIDASLRDDSLIAMNFGDIAIAYALLAVAEAVRDSAVTDVTVHQP